MLEAFDSCLGCRACETACPSGVEYGAILELARENLNDENPHPAQKTFLDSSVHPIASPLMMFLGQLSPSGKMPEPMSRMISGQKPQVAIPSPQEGHFPPFGSELPPIDGQVSLLEGCVMRTLFPRVHEATRRLLRRVGLEAEGTGSACCGALHAHNGYLSKAETLAKELIARVPKGQLMITDSAGCGSMMKSYQHLKYLNNVEFSSCVRDISEILVERGLTKLLQKSAGLSVKAVYQDACHLAHGQKIRSEPRELLSAVPGLQIIAMDEPELCCGSAGVFNHFQPEMARSLLERKWSNLQKTGADIVITGNPGCHAWIAQASKEKGSAIRVFHTAEILESALCGYPVQEMGE